MPSTPVRVLLDGRSFLECPRWRDGRLWVADQYLGEVLAVDPDTGTAEVMAVVPSEPAGLGWLPDGPLLVVSMRDRRVLRQEPTGELVTHADLAGLVDGRTNDMVVDDAGRAYVGNFGFDLMAGEPPRPTVLVRVDPDGTAVVAATDVAFPNGSVILQRPVGAGGQAARTLVVAETFEFRLTAFDLLPDGSLGDRRVWADLSAPGGQRAAGLPADDRPVAADGICADAEGAVWVADPMHNRVVRVREGGEICDEVSTGELGSYACALGGADGRTLFVCTAQSFFDDERRATRESRLVTVRVDVPAPAREPAASHA